jgi:hypothetical protein
LYPPEEISASLVVVEFIKRVDMRTINSFVALFAPIGLFPCAIRPLVDAALDLMNIPPVSIQGKGA